MSLRSQARIRLLLGDEIAFGPGKADLLEAIRQTGSISAAARRLQMSYRRAWLLVETMNECFQEPLVDSLRGGAGGGGAKVTEAGDAILAAYRELQTEVASVIESGMVRFAGKTRPLRTLTSSD